MSNELLATQDDLRSAYRLLLFREVDDSGAKHFGELIRKRLLTTRDLAHALVHSEEYTATRAARDELVELKVGGCVVYARRGDDLIGASIRDGHDYEPYVMKPFLEACKPGAFVLDIGANIGIFTMQAAARVGDGGRVFAVEPLAQNLRALYRAAERNRFANIAFYPVAASDRSAIATVSCDADSSNGIVDLLSAGADVSGRVPCHRVDDLLAGIERLDVVKMDIEGLEPTAWLGISTLLGKFRPQIFTEFSPVAMRNQGQIAPDEYLGMVFAYSDRVRVLHRDRAAVACSSPGDVMAQWQEANKRLGMQGELHLDLHING